MSVHFEHTIEVPQSPERVFALLDDVTQTPKWLARCTRIQVLSMEEKAVGTGLLYSYREGSRVGDMEGKITARNPNERLTYNYQDKMMDVIVDFRMNPASAGTRLSHAITITPRTFFARLMAPMIRKAMPAQTIDAMEKLRTLLAAG